MARSYTFAELVALSGDSANTIKNLVQKGVIRPDIKGTKGTGDHRTFGFLDVFEACVAARLNQIPGGMPTYAVSLALDVIRFETVMGELSPSPWGLFLDPDTRESSKRFWLCWSKDGRSAVLEADSLEAFLNENSGVVVLVRLDPVLVALEQLTQDHASAAERTSSWMKAPAKSKTAKSKKAVTRK